MQNSDLRFSATIDLSKIDVNGAQNTDYRKITLEDTTDYTALSIPLGELSGYFVIKDPLGNFIHLGNFTTPDIEQDTSLIYDGSVIPLDAYNKPVNGDYQFQLFVKRVWSVGETINEAEYNTTLITVKVCGELASEIGLTFDCNKSISTGRDLTKYKSNMSVERLMTLAPPVGAKYIDGTDASNFVTSGLLVQSNALWTETWQLLLRAVTTEINIYGVLTSIQYNSIETRRDAKAVCNINICSLMKCFDKRIIELERKANRVGGISNDYLVGEEMMQLTNLYIRLQGARECGNITNASKYYESLKGLLMCDCGCGDSGIPEYVYPLVSTPGDNVVVAGSQYIAVTGNTVGNTTTYTVALSSAMTSLINLIKVYDIESSDDTIDVSSTTTGTTVVFDITVNTSELDDIFGSELDAVGLTSETTMIGIIQALIDKEREGNLPPVAEPDTIVITENTTGTCLVTANDFFTSNVVVTVTTLPSNGTATVEADNKTISYVPTTNWTGTDVLTYTITDADSNTSTATLTIIVDPVAGASCVTVTAQFIASLSVQSGLIQVVITNLTNYLTNIPNTNAYVIDVRDSGNNILHTYSVTGNNNSVAQVYTISDTPLSTWDNIRVSQTVTSKNGAGVSCGTTTSTNNYTTPDISSSIFAGVTVTCLGVTNADPDTTIMQALVSKSCASLTEVTVNNGLIGTGTALDPVQLGAPLIKDTTVSGAYSITWNNKYHSIIKNGNDYNTDGAFNRSEGGFTLDRTLLVGESVLGENHAYSGFFSGVTENLSTKEVFIIGSQKTLSLGGDSATITSPVDINGDRNYGLINQLLTTAISSSNVSLTVDRITNQFIDGIWAGLNTGTIDVTECIQLFIRRQDAGSIPGEYVLATNRYAIYQEGEDDENVFYGDISYYGLLTNASDERSKDVTGEYNKALEAINKVNIIKYKRKKGFGDVNREQIGVIAQQLEQHIPEAVNTGRDSKSGIEDFKSVKTDVLIYTLINAVKELSAQVTYLKEKVSELEDKNS